MMTYTRHSEHDFTLIVSKGDTTIDEWLNTLAQYSAEGISRLELYDLREHTNLFSNDEIEMILDAYHRRFVTAILIQSRCNSSFLFFS
jgi:hypothetical protein